MEIRFYRCILCHRAIEKSLLIKRHKCVCGGKRVSPAYLPPLELWWYIIRNPAYLRKAIKGEKLYADSDNSLPNS
jgi:hypothetical protein